MQKYYIVETATLERGEGKHPLPGYEYLTCEGHTQKWVSTHESLESAISKAAALKDEPETVMVMVAEWQGEGVLTTGSQAILQCAPGAKIKKIHFYAERKYEESKYATMAMNSRWHDVTTGPWHEHLPNISDYQLGGGNWLKFNPEKIPA